MTTYNNEDSLVQKVKESLSFLGNSPATIAATLRDCGIKGTHSAMSCPIANYLSSKGFYEPVVYDHLHVGEISDGWT